MIFILKIKRLLQYSLKQAGLVYFEKFEKLFFKVNTFKTKCVKIPSYQRHSRLPSCYFLVNWMCCPVAQRLFFKNRTSECLPVNNYESINMLLAKTPPNLI